MCLVGQQNQSWTRAGLERTVAGTNSGWREPWPEELIPCDWREGKKVISVVPQQTSPNNHPLEGIVFLMS
jgi:alkyl hydroperoxide reductase subunit AhpC